VDNKKIVIDTNVFISAIIGKYSYPYKIFDELIATAEVQICISQVILYEYKNVSEREKFKKYKGFSERAAALLQSIEEIGIWIESTEQITKIKDDADNRFLELAIAAQAYCIVTGNINDFDFEEFKGVKILTPATFYELIMSENLK
jgi:uncharacterized protein